MTHASTEQPEALQYATALRSNSVFFTPKYMGFIAEELERLHAHTLELEYRVSELEQQRAELLEALKGVKKWNKHLGMLSSKLVQSIDEAIKKAEATE